MNLKKKGFQLPDTIRFDEETLTGAYGKFTAEPFERGYGTTIGNSLRRILLSSLEGSAVTAVKIPGALHEFSKITGVKEDVIDIILNIKKLNFIFEGEGQKTATFDVKGPANITGGDLKCDPSVEVLNPEQVIASIEKGAKFEAELFIQKGKGYVPAELNKEDQPVGVIAVDAVFAPVQKVNFWVEKARVGRATDYDRLIMEIWTDGSITPEKAVSQAASIIIEHMNLFVAEEEVTAVVKDEPQALSTETTDSTLNSSLMKNVDELELSVRSYNCLKNANIKTIYDLVRKTEQEMLKTKNFGRKSLNEIKEIISRMGLHLGMNVDMESLSDDEAS